MPNTKQTQPSNKGVRDPHFSLRQYFWRYCMAHVSALGVSFRTLSLAPLATFLTVLALGVCLSLPLGIYLLTQNMHKLTKDWESGSAVTVYVDHKAQAAQIESIVAKAKSYAFVKDIRFLSADNALQEFQQASGMNDVLSLLNENPLPHVISIDLEPQGTTQEELIQMKDTLAKMPKVTLASFDHDWVEKLQRFLDLGHMLTQILYAIVGFGVLLVIGNTIRLSLERHKDEIEVLRLMGATQAFIRRPFLYRGLIFGVLGGTISLLILSIAMYLLKEPTQQLVSLYNGLFSLETLPLIDAITILIVSAGLGWFGALIAFSQQRSALKYDSP